MGRPWYFLEAIYEIGANYLEHLYLGAAAAGAAKDDLISGTSNELTPLIGLATLAKRCHLQFIRIRNSG